MIFFIWVKNDPEHISDQCIIIDQVEAEVEVSSLSGGGGTDHVSSRCQALAAVHVNKGCESAASHLNFTPPNRHGPSRRQSRHALTKPSLSFQRYVSFDHILLVRS